MPQKRGQDPDKELEDADGEDDTQLTDDTPDEFEEPEELKFEEDSEEASGF